MYLLTVSALYNIFQIHQTDFSDMILLIAVKSEDSKLLDFKIWLTYPKMLERRM